MKKPEGYDDVQAFTGDFQVLPAGGYVCRIISAKEVTSQNGNDMLEIEFDVDKGEFKDIYTQAFEGSEKRKWPHVGKFVQLIYGTDGRANQYFKGMMVNIEKSNPEFVWDWDERTLKGKLFGGVFGREEYFNQYRGEYTFNTKLKFVRAVDVIERGRFVVPEDKLDPANSKNTQSSLPIVNLEISEDDDLPF